MSRLAGQLDLAPGEQAVLLPSGRQTLFSNRVHWARTSLGKAGLLESTRRGHFKITQAGRQVLNSHPPRIDNAFLEQFERFWWFRASARAPQNGSSDKRGLQEAELDPGRAQTADEIMRAAYKQIYIALT